MDKKLPLLITLLTLTLTPEANGKVYQLNIVKKSNLQKTPETNLIVYKVKQGDTLLGIMRKFKIPPRFLKEIVKLNKLRNPNLIYAGQKLKLPIGKKPAQSGKKKSGFNNILTGIRLIGGKVENDGILFLNSGTVDYSRFPKVEIKNKSYVVDFNKSLADKIKQELESLGLQVLNKQELSDLFLKELSKNFSSLKKNGKLILGFNDVLTYKYDYLGYNKTTGKRTVINLSPDTPKSLLNLLKAYDIDVIQPPRKKTDIKKGEGNGRLKILSGDGLKKLASVINIVTGEPVKETELGIELPSSKIYVLYDIVEPEERVKLELKGYRTLTLTGNFITDLRNIFDMIPVVNKPIKLIVNEPPLTDGKRSKFEIMGLLVNYKDKEWFLVDSVEKPEEIPYLIYRGVNLIVY